MFKKLFLLGLLTHFAQAQITGDDLFSLSLEELMEIEITGSTLTNESLTTVPAAVTVFTHKQLRYLGLETLSELIHIVPGFQSYRAANTSYSHPFSSRGRRIGYNSADILILLDGQRLNAPRSSGINDSVPAYPLKNIERVEFIRGPGAAVYGSNAMMGVINIISRTDANELNVGLGTNQHKHVSALVTHELGEVSLSLAGRLDVDQGQQYQILRPLDQQLIDTQDPYLFADAYLKLDWQGTQLNLQYNQSEFEDFLSGARVSNDYEELSKHWFVNLKHPFKWLQFDSYFWSSYSRSKSTQMDLLAPPRFPIVAPAINVFEDSEVRLQWHNVNEGNSDNKIQFGAEYRKVKVPQATFIVGNPALNEVVILESSSRDILGVYGQYQTTIAQKNTVTLGLRYDHFASIGSKLSSRMAWVNTLSEFQSIKVLYGEAFRAPTETELNLVNNSVIVGNQDLVPEIVKSVDVIWFGQWPAMTVSAGYFHNRFEHAINTVEVGNNRLMYENTADDQQTKGLELEINYEFNAHLMLHATFTKLTDKPSSFLSEADQFASLNLNYHQQNWYFSMTSSYQGTREMWAFSGEKILLQDYWQWFAKIGYALSSEWQTYVQVKNVSDEVYFTPPSFPNMQNGTPNRGREMMLGIQYQF